MSTLQFKKEGQVYYYRLSATSRWIIDCKRTEANRRYTP